MRSHGPTSPPLPGAVADAALARLWPEPGSDIERAQQCAERLSRFVLEAWPIVEPATAYVSAWHVETVCEHLEAVSGGEIKRLIVNVPPRTMKSLSVSVFWPAWEWLKNPALRWVFASYAENLAQRDSLKMRRLIRSAGGRSDGTLFQRVGYRGVLGLVASRVWELTKDQDAKRMYENTETGMRLATGVGGIATGEGGDRIVVDDPLSAKQARSDAERNAANDWWDGTMSTRFNNADAAAVIVMQRLHEQDLTGHLLERGGWHHLCLPAEYEPSHPFVYPAQVALPSGRVLVGDPREVEGELLDAERLPRSRLDELARDLGSYAYAGQMQQRPAPAAGGMFKRYWWQRSDGLDRLDPGAWDQQIASWDMRFSDHDKATTSYVVGQVWGVRAYPFSAERWLLGQIRARIGFTDTVKAVEALRAWAPLVGATLVERKANGAAVLDTLRSTVPGLIPIEPDGSKEARAAAVSPFVEAGNVVLPAGEVIPAPPGYEPTSVDDFIEETATFPRGHDDQVDAMSQALNWLRNAALWTPMVTAPPSMSLGFDSDGEIPRDSRGELAMDSEYDLLHRRT